MPKLEYTLPIIVIGRFFKLEKFNIPWTDNGTYEIYDIKTKI